MVAAAGARFCLQGVLMSHASTFRVVLLRALRVLLVLGTVGGLAALVVTYRSVLVASLKPFLPGAAGLALDREPTAADDHDHDAATDLGVVELSVQARRNLGITATPLRLRSGWRTITIPGEITDRPGISDQGVTSPVVGVVTKIHAYPGDTVRPGEPLFTLRLLSEYVQNAQSELFKATRELQLEQEKRLRLEQIGTAIPGARLIEIDQQQRRLQASITSARQDLLTRGLTPDQIEQVAVGKFVSTVEIAAPPVAEHADPAPVAGGAEAPVVAASAEVQELSVELGSQVQAGQLLATLSNHRLLYAVGHAFKGEAPALERATREAWPVQLEFAEDDPAGWDPLPENSRIRHIANTIDVESRTFDFFVPLVNQSRSYEREGASFVVWRFRPGQRVRLLVPIEQLTDVFVLPADAVARDGPEAYVFRQNGDLFNRLSVHVLHADRRNVIIANDGSLAPGWFVAASAAASLNRVLAAQLDDGAPAGMHVHADGTVHEAH